MTFSSMHRNLKKYGKYPLKFFFVIYKFPKKKNSEFILLNILYLNFYKN